jgi:hypothetical protein
MERANTFIVEDCPALWKIADNCARHEVNFERRHAYISYKLSSGILISMKNTLR